MKAKKIVLVLATLLFFCGLICAAYPIWHGKMLEQDLWQSTSKFLAQTVSSSEADTALPGAEIDPLFLAAESYNQEIFENCQADFNSREAYEASCLSPEDYGYDSDIFAVISIPSLGLEMPVYLGASPENLALGAAHMGQTSLPIGGQSTNSVIAGHRGWKGADYFKYIPSLQLGDEVIITNLWEKLTYRVIEIRDIYSSDTDALLIQPGRDLVTLLTCDYGANGLKLRCLVICERAE